MIHDVVCILSVVGIYVARMRELRTPRDTIAGPVRENTTLRLFVISGTLMTLGAIVELLVLQPPFRPLVFAAGWVLALASFAIRRAAIRALGRFWSLHVEIRQEHQLVREGPFRWVRHPTYLSMILELAAIGLLLQSRFASLAGLVMFVPTLLWRIRIEEEALVEKFGAAYVAYRRETPAVFPLWLPRSTGSGPAS